MMQFPPVMQQYMQPRAPVPMSNLAPPLYVGDLDDNIREEALYDLFSKFGQIYFIRLMRDPGTGKSRGFAYVNFCHPRDAENAKHVAQYEKLGRKHIRIMYKRPNIKQLNNTANVFIKNIDKAAIIKDLHAEFSKFGPILSAKLAVDQKGESLGYGYVQFENDSDAKKALEAILPGQYKFKETIIEATGFKARSERAPKQKNNLYIKHLPDRDENVLREEIEKHFKQFGTIEQMAVRKDVKINKYYAFVCFKENDAADKAVSFYKDSPPNPFGDPVPCYVSFAQTRQERDEELRAKKAQSNHQNNLFLKNLKAETTKDLLKDAFSRFGEVVSCEAKEWNNVANPTKKLKYGFVAFKGVEEAAQARNDAPEDVEIKKLFADEKPYINVFQPRDQRSKFLQTQWRSKYSGGGGGLPNYGQFQPNPEMQMNLSNPNRRVPSMFPPFQYGGPMQGAVGPTQMRGGYHNQPMNRKPYGPPRNNMQIGGDRRGPRPPGQWNNNYQQQRPPMGTGMPRNQPMGGNRPPFQQQFDNRQNRPYNQGPKDNISPPTHSDPNKGSFDQKAQKGGSTLASGLTIADLKNKWQDFIKLDKDKQRNILGELLFPLIKERVGESNAPKITGMLIDLDVLEIQDIFEFLEDRDLLDERIKEANELIITESA